MSIWSKRKTTYAEKKGKMNMKKFAVFALALIMLLSMTACGESEKAGIKIGTSNFSMILPEGYEKADDDYEEDQIAYYYKDDESIDFDVYQWDKEDKYTLESEAEYFAGEYGTQPKSVVINGINCLKYISEEEYEGYTYTVANCMFEDDDSIFELCLWTIDTDEEYAAVDAIINTLKKN